MRSLKRFIKRGSKAIRNSGVDRPDASHVTAHIVATDRGVRVEAGPVSFSMRLVEGDWAPPQTADYAAYGLAALSMSKAFRVTLDAPVSKSAAQKIGRLSQIYRLWSIRELAPLQIEFPHIVDDIEPERDASSVITMSGGVDSTHAAIEAMKDGRRWEGLLLAGADYPDSQHPGFVDLRKRVREITERLGMAMNVVETNIRSARLKWEMLHGFNLAASLHFMSMGRTSGAYALDYHELQDFSVHPWGNNAALPNYFGTATFPIRGIGKTHYRVEKLAEIHGHDPKLLELLSFCFTDIDTGANCGQCVKCVNTRLAYLAIGISDENAFRAYPDLTEQIATFPIPDRIATIRLFLTRACELADALPQGRERDAVIAYENALRERYRELMPV